MARLVPQGRTMTIEGAPLTGVWPPALPDELRVAVEADAGARGFSHVSALGADGPVLLLAADALLVWSAPGDLRRLDYDAVEITKRVAGNWRIAVPAPPQDDDLEHGSQSPTAEVTPPLTFEVTKDVGSRVRDRARRAGADREVAAVAAFGALTLPVAHVREPALPATIEHARPQPLERDEDPVAGPRHSVTDRAAEEDPAPSLSDAAASRLDAPPTDAAGGLSNSPPITGVVVSVLGPIGYVRVRPRDVLIVAKSAAQPLFVGEHVSLVPALDGILLATAGSPSPPETAS